MFEIVPFDRHIRHLAAMDPFREFDELERSFFGNTRSMVSAFRTDVVDTGDAFKLEEELRPNVYRIGDISEMDEIGYEDYFYGDGICFIEWANLIEEILPEHYTEIVIEKNLEKGFDYRLITMTKK